MLKCGNNLARLWVDRPAGFESQEPPTSNRVPLEPSADLPNPALPIREIGTVMACSQGWEDPVESDGKSWNQGSGTGEPTLSGDN